MGACVLPSRLSPACGLASPEAPHQPSAQQPLLVSPWHPLSPSHSPEPPVGLSHICDFTGHLHVGHQLRGWDHTGTSKQVFCSCEAHTLPGDRRQTRCECWGQRVKWFGAGGSRTRRSYLRPSTLRLQTGQWQRPGQGPRKQGTAREGRLEGVRQSLGRVRTGRGNGATRPTCCHTSGNLRRVPLQAGLELLCLEKTTLGPCGCLGDRLWCGWRW